jgi:hypothetical protein
MDGFECSSCIFISVLNWCALYMTVKALHVFVRQCERVGFKGEQPGMPPWGLYTTEIDSIDFVEIFAHQKSRKISLCFS